MDSVDELILIAIRELSDRKAWSCPTEVHRLLNLVEVNKAPPNSEFEAWEVYYIKTLKRLAQLMRYRYVREVELFEHGQVWEHFRLTRKGRELIEGKRTPDAIYNELKPVMIDFDAIDAALAGGLAEVEKREFVPMRKRKIKVQTKPYWNSGAGYEPIKWLSQ